MTTFVPLSRSNQAKPDRIGDGSGGIRTGQSEYRDEAILHLRFQQGRQREATPGEDVQHAARAEELQNGRRKAERLRGRVLPEMRGRVHGGDRRLLSESLL